MSDLVRRLRAETPNYGPSSTTQMLREEAADEIERLRAALKSIADDTPMIVVGNDAGWLMAMKMGHTANAALGDQQLSNPTEETK